MTSLQLIEDQALLTQFLSTLQECQHHATQPHSFPSPSISAFWHYNSPYTPNFKTLAMSISDLTTHLCILEKHEEVMSKMCYSKVNKRYCIELQICVIVYPGNTNSSFLNGRRVLLWKLHVSSHKIKEAISFFISSDLNLQKHFNICTQK